MPPWLAPLTDLGGWAAIIGAIALLLKNKAELAGIREQLHPDHGSSMADAVNRTEAAAGGITAQLADQGETLDNLADKVESLDHRIGHEVGELRRDTADLRHDANIIHQDHASRLRHIEAGGH